MDEYFEDINFTEEIESFEEFDRYKYKHQMKKMLLGDYLENPNLWEQRLDSIYSRYDLEKSRAVAKVPGRYAVRCRGAKKNREAQ